MSLSKEAKKVLERAREILSDPKRWTKGNAAKDKFGQEIRVTSPHAVKFCVIGALAKADYELDSSELNYRRLISGSDRVGAALRHFHDTLGHKAGDPGFFGIGPWNDSSHTTHKDVMAAFDKAIETA